MFCWESLDPGYVDAAWHAPRSKVLTSPKLLSKGLRNMTKSSRHWPGIHAGSELFWLYKGNPNNTHMVSKPWFTGWKSCVWPIHPPTSHLCWLSHWCAQYCTCIHAWIFHISARQNVTLTQYPQVDQQVCCTLWHKPVSEVLEPWSPSLREGWSLGEKHTWVTSNHPWCHNQ